MKKLFLASAIFASLASLQAMANPLLHLNTGRLHSSNNVVSQVISVENKTGGFIDNIRIECGFYSGEYLVAFGFTFIENLPPETVGHGAVTVTSGENITSAKCRIVSPR